jgi:hypothetical protein
MLLTYDPTTKKYPGVMMHGTNRILVDGIWDEATTTMTFSGTFTIGGDKFVFQNRFIDKENCESTGVITNSDGKVVMKQTHKQTRRR